MVGGGGVRCFPEDERGSNKASKNIKLFRERFAKKLL